jgi:hypothetical protein
MPRQRPTKPEKPRSEPEILPPARGRQAYQPADWYTTSSTSRIFIARPSPWSIFGIALMIGLVAGAALAIVLGTLLIVVPIVVLLIGGMVLSSAVRARLRR